MSKNGVKKAFFRCQILAFPCENRCQYSNFSISFIKNSSESVQIAHEFDKKHVNNLVVEELEGDSSYKILKIVAPDFVSIVEEIRAKYGEEIKSLSNKEDMAMFLRKHIIGILDSGNFKVVVNEVKVDIVDDEYGNEKILSTHEYLNAIYGGLVDYYAEFENSFNESMSNMEVAE